VPTPPASDSPDDRTALEPIRVLRPRRTDALAQLLDEIRQDKDYRSHTTVTAPLPHTRTGRRTRQRNSRPSPAAGRGTPRTRRRRPPAASRGPPAPRARTAPGGRGDRGRRGGRRRLRLLPPDPQPYRGHPGRTLGERVGPPRDVGRPSAVGAADVLANPGFESGSVSPWTCTGNPGSIVSSPVHAGSKALQGTVSSSDTAQCDQTVAVRPNTTYSLSGWVRGSYVYLGVNGGTSTWTTSPYADTAH
jgi:hypothetical protein